MPAVALQGAKLQLILPTMRLKNWKKNSFMVLVLWLALPCWHPAAGAPLEIDPDQQFAFAERYFATGEYFRAIGEYQRFIYFFPGEPRVARARFQIGLSNFRSNRFKEAIAAFIDLIENEKNPDLNVRAFLMISECHGALKEYEQAANILRHLIAQYAQPRIRDEAYYRLGWLYVEAAEWEKAQQAFDRISSGNRDRYRLQQISEGLDRAGLIKQKDPALAGLLAILPGAGHLYIERYQDALIAFLLNGILIFATVEAFRNDSPALGGLLTFVELGFYAGNIYGATSGAHKYNREQIGGFIQQLRSNTKLQLAMQPEKRRVGLALRIAF